MKLTGLIMLEDDINIVLQVEKALKSKGVELFAFDPESLDRPEIFLQFESFCESNKNNCQVALVDFQLWANMNGTLFVESLKKTGIPFIGFSSNIEGNEILLTSGAVTVIDKLDFYLNRGFDDEMFIEQLIAAVEAK